MIKLKVKVKLEDKTYIDTLYLPEDYNISKANPDFIQIINKVCKDSTFEKPDTVNAIINMEL